MVTTAALLLTLARPLSAATLHVPADHATVRDAVDAAATGDTVLVAPGVHSGGVFINGKAVTVASWYVASGDTAMISATILNGVAGHPCTGGARGCAGNAVLEFGDDANGSAVVGLTLTHGENGIGSGSTVDVTHCRIIANGDGVDYVAGAGGTFRNSLFANNTDDGIDLNGRMNVVITNNDIRDNLDDGIEFRLYAQVGVTSQVDIIGNRINGNGEDGVQIIDYPGTASYAIRIERNLFRSNYDGSGSSAAIACMPNGETIESLAGAPVAEPIHVINNTFIGERNGVVGGANLVALNNVLIDTEGTALLRVGGGSIASYTLLWHNGTDHTESNLDPPHLLYVSPRIDGTGRLTPLSPAIDAGIAVFEWQGQTVLSVPVSDYAGSAPDLGAFETAPNAAPLVSAGPDRTVTLSLDADEVVWPGALLERPAVTFRAEAGLDGTVSDDGLPYPSAPRTTWSVVSGPGPVKLASRSMAATRATFSAPGDYVLRLTANDGLLSASDLVQVTVEPALNEPPVVDAGPQQIITLPSHAMLDGTVLDDGIPLPPGRVTTAWTQAGGPAPVTFDDPARVNARATFGVAGTYVLRLTASDGALDASDSVLVLVLPIPNEPPQVDAGPDQIIMIPSDAILDGTVTDDALPVPPGTVATTWSAVSGPGPVTFQDPSFIDTRAGFTTAGTYILRLTASDGAVDADDLVQVTVEPPPPAVERRVGAGSDDAEESDSGTYVRNASDLDLVYDSGNQTVGLRFADIAVPPGATIIRAHIQFEADATQSEPTSLLLQGQAADNPPTFVNADRNVSSRPRTAASASWSPPPWAVVGEAGPDQRTCDLAAVVQEIVDRPGWASGNAIAIIITGTGKRTARTQEIHPSAAALLLIEYGGLPQPMRAVPADSGMSVDAAGPTVAGSGPASVVEAGPSTGVVRALELGLHGVSPQPSRGALRVDFTLGDGGPATLELVDVAGRRVIARDLTALGAGRHAVDLRAGLPVGVYLVRLTQAGRALVRKAVILR